MKSVYTNHSSLLPLETIFLVLPKTKKPLQNIFEMNEKELGLVIYQRYRKCLTFLIYFTVCT